MLAGRAGQHCRCYARCHIGQDVEGDEATEEGISEEEMMIGEEK